MAKFFESFPPRVLRVYSAHFLASIGSNFLLPAFFFYAKQVFGWGTRRSLLLAAAEGAFYIVGALMAHTLARLAGRRKALVGIQLAAAACCVAAWIDPTPAVVVPAVLAYVAISASGWPILESLVSSGTGPDLLSRRVGAYNLVWSFVGALTMAVSGAIIHTIPSGVFFISAAAHLIAVGFISIASVEPPVDSMAHPHAEPALLAQRKLAMQLSRIGLPATYVVVYSLVAIMPSLAVIQSLGPSKQTAIASVWMAARFLAFVVLGGTVWWHTRPKILLIAAVMMLFAFLGVTLRPADLAGTPMAAVTNFDEGLMIGWQVVLGISMGMIYAASLYFGMVLSEGSAEQGGYHEALIGLGQVVGPAAAAGAQAYRPGDNRAAVVAVGAIVTVSVVTAAALSVRNNQAG
jgi:MFS family permease